MDENGERSAHEPVSISVYLDDDAEPLSVHRPPARVSIDTTKLPDGEHELRIQAVDAVGSIGVRTLRFTVANGPGITITGLRQDERVRGAIDIEVNAFGAGEPFDPERAESWGPIPVWTWVLFAIIAGWSTWYGIEFFQTPAAFAATPTYAANPALAAANEPATQSQVPAPAAVHANAALGSKTVAGFDYSTVGAQVYGQSCQACHGATGAGVPGAFPPLAGDVVVNGPGNAHIRIVLDGLSGKTIAGTHYASQMPSFKSQLTAAQIAAVIDHERTSWGNHGPVVTPEEVQQVR
ncbi:MAG: cytochrome c [Candidatus Aquilonibacter sp.]